MSGKPGLEPDEEASTSAGALRKTTTTIAAATGGAATTHVEDPAGIGARLYQRQQPGGQAQLLWQEHIAAERKYQLGEAVPARKVYNATIQVDELDEGFTLGKLRNQTRWFDKRYFESFVPHDLQLVVALSESKVDEQPRADRRSSICADVGLVTYGRKRENHFHVLGLATGITGNQFSVIVAEDTFKRMHKWSKAPVPEESNVIMTFPTPILDLKVVSSFRGIIFGIRTASNFTLLQFVRDEKQVKNNLEAFSWQPPVHLDSACFGGNRLADFALSPYIRDHRDRLAVFVDVCGGIWRTRSLQRLTDYAESPVPSRYGAVEQLRMGNAGRIFETARVTFGRDDQTLIVVRDTVVRSFSLQDHRLDSTILHMREAQSAPFLDLATPDRAWPMSSLRVCLTAKEIIWIDLDKPDVATIRYKHHRDKTDGLALTATYYEGLYYAFLWSRDSAALTVYTYTADGPALLPSPPYDLTPPVPQIARSGVACIHLPTRNKRQGSSGGESIVLVEADVNGSVYVRELAHVGTRSSARLAFKRLNVEEPLDSYLEQDLKGSLPAHLFMLYNRLFTGDNILHINHPEDAILRHPIDLDHSDEMQIPLDNIRLDGRPTTETCSAHASTSIFTSDRAVDAASLPPQAVERELRSLEASEKLAYGYVLDERHLDTGPARSTDEATALADRLGTIYHSARFKPLNTDGDESEPSPMEQAHRFADAQLAVDLSLSRHALSIKALQSVLHDVEDGSMFDYDRIADLPDVSFGYFTPRQDDQSLRVTNAARALLSEWTLGADPNIRPPFRNPYSQQVREEKVADKQLKAFKKRVAKGGVMSASQPLPVPVPVPARATAATQRAPNKKLPSVPVPNGQQHDSQDTLVATQRTQVPPDEEATQAAAPSTDVPMPFSQVVGGAYGGRPLKKRKKRAGGF